MFIADAPGHGYYSGSDNHPNGSPEGHKLEELMANLAYKKIHFTFVKLDDNCNKMIDVMIQKQS